MAMQEPQSKREHVEENLFSDLSYFDELERRIVAIIDRFEKLRSESDQLRSVITKLEGKLKQITEENAELLQRQEELLRSQRDGDKEKLVRQKVSVLLKKLEEI